LRASSSPRDGEAKSRPSFTQIFQSGFKGEGDSSRSGWMASGASWNWQNIGCKSST